MDSTLVLIVDDDEDDSMLLSELLAEVNPTTRCTFASDGVEALSFLTHSPRLPHFIFLDINMPKMNGKECLRIIKRHDHLKHIPVIIHSTTRYILDIEETRALGASFFMTKSISTNQTRLALETIFAQKNSKPTENSMIILE